MAYIGMLILLHALNNNPPVQRDQILVSSHSIVPPSVSAPTRIEADLTTPAPRLCSLARRSLPACSLLIFSSSLPSTPPSPLYPPINQSQWLPSLAWWVLKRPSGYIRGRGRHLHRPTSRARTRSKSLPGIVHVGYPRAPRLHSLLSMSCSARALRGYYCTLT